MTHAIGVMGGMFDPVHNGHLVAALAAIKTLRLDELRLLPCAVPNHRNPALASAEHRVAMLQLVASADSRLLVDGRELNRPGTSYTVDSLLSLHAEFPDSSLVLVLGTDAFQSLPSWHRWQEIFSLCHICVVSRSGADKPLHKELARRQTNQPADLKKAKTGCIYWLENKVLDVASSVVRQQLQDGAMPDQVPRAVAQYIQQHQLYQFTN